jgi:hypothetical protein
METKLLIEKEDILRVIEPFRFKFWAARLKMNSKFFQFLYLLLIISNFWSYFTVVGFDRWLANNAYFNDVVYLSAIFASLYIQNTLPKQYEEMMRTSSGIFRNIAEYKKFQVYVSKRFSSKLEKLLPLALGILLFLVYLAMTLPKKFNYHSTAAETIYFTTDYTRYVYMYWFFASTLTYSITAILAVDMVLLIYFTFGCLNKLGSAEYPLKVTYVDLKIGAFTKIGQFLISLSIPIIFLATIISIIGMFYNILYTGYLLAYLYMGAGILIAFSLSYLLYHNTLHIHHSIVSFKDDLIYETITKVQDLLAQENRNYRHIEIVHNFYREIQAINVWPFNPRSLKKLTLTLGSTVVPFFLSFLGW